MAALLSEKAIHISDTIVAELPPTQGYFIGFHASQNRCKARMTDTY